MHAQAQREQDRAEFEALAAIPNLAWAKAHRAVRDGHVLVVTGAGVSAESGIPTFRSADGTGIYETEEEHNPLELLRSSTLEHRIDVLWDYYLTRFAGAMKGAKPNDAHYAIADLDTYMFRRTAGEFLLVTQNIDGLHLEAGGDERTTIELHGNKSMRCSDECWIRNNDGRPKLAPIPENAKFPEDLTCPDCGSMMRPHVLLFDEHYSQELYRSESAQAMAVRADLIITVGCSAVVPIAQILANFTVQHEGVVIDVNPGDGPLAELAEQTGVRLRGRAGVIMPKLVEFLMS